MSCRLFALVLLGLLIGCPPPPFVPPSPPAPPTATATAKPMAHPRTEKRSVQDAYHGVSVRDDYRWLEDWKDPEVKKWSGEQNAHARSILDALPHVPAIRGRLDAILRASSTSYDHVSSSGGKLFAIKHQPPKQQPFLVVMDSLGAVDSARIIVDPNTIDAKGTTAIDWFVPSHSGKLVAVSLSKGGTESGDLHIYDTQSGKQVHEVIERVNGGTAGGSLAWSPDDKSFFYTRYPRGKERPAKDMSFYVQVYHHVLGSSGDKDSYELGKNFPRIAEIELVMHQPSGQLLATVQKGDGGEFAHYLRGKTGRGWKQFSDYGDKIIQAAFGAKRDLLVLSRKNAPRGQILSMPIANLDPAKAKVLIAEGKDTIVSSFWSAPSVLATDKKLYVLYQLGGPSMIRVFDHSGAPVEGPKQLPVAAAGGMTRLGGDDILFENKSFVEPPAWYRFEAATGKTTKSALATDSPVDMRKVQVIREMATSKDGTKVPVNILLPPGSKRDGTGRCVINGYGGYGVSLAPRYRPYYAVLIEQGVCYAVANLRGGGEFGETWHREGNLTKKQNVFDDFAAVIEHMVARKYTASDKLAIIGGSNGGLLMGATMAQHPTLMKAVVSFVGIYDMLRVELSPNGAFNVTEFGTVKKPDHFKAMFAYSPYHNLKDGVAYPATLLLTGENDPRVDPMQSRKMAARLQAASSSSAPILLRTAADAGHGGSSSLTERVAQTTDAYAFIFKQLGVDYKDPGAQ